MASKPDESSKSLMQTPESFVAVAVLQENILKIKGQYQTEKDFQDFVTKLQVNKFFEFDDEILQLEQDKLKFLLDRVIQAVAEDHHKFEILLDIFIDTPGPSEELAKEILKPKFTSKL